MTERDVDPDVGGTITRQINRQRRAVRFKDKP